MRSRQRFGVEFFRSLLTQEDRNVIADLGARALAVAEGRVERVLAEREAALQSQIAAASARADDTIAVAEAMVSEANRQTLEALATSEAARVERDSAIAAATEANQRALHLEGQLTQLMADKVAEAARRSEIEADLVTSKAKLAAEVALRLRQEADLEALTAELANLRNEYADKVKDSADILARTREALALEQGRLEELTNQRVRSIETIEHLEGELSRHAGEVSKSAAALAIADAAVAAREAVIRDISMTLSAEQVKTKQLMSVVAADRKYEDTLRSLEAAIASLASSDTLAPRG